jgi:hypothetical protein
VTRYPQAHAAGFLSTARFVTEGPFGPDSPLGACHEWTGGLDANGYGRMLVNGKYVSAHRLSWELTDDNGPIPPGMSVLHKCDNRRCVLGEHLFLGTAADNSADMVQKGRSKACNAPGEKNSNARLSEEEVEEIRERYRAGDISQAALGREFGVTQMTISLVVREATHKKKKGPAMGPW